MNIIFFPMFIVLIILSMYAFIGYSFLVKICKWAMYFTQRPDCNFKQTIGILIMQEDEKNVWSPF